MAVFGWIMFSLFAIFGLGILVIFAIPFVVTETTMMGAKIKKAIEDKKFDLEKRSEARRHRDELKRQKDFELANKKLDAKLQKVDKQIEIQQKKLELAKQYKEQATAEKQELNKSSVKEETVVEAPTDVVEEIKQEEIKEQVVESTIKTTTSTIPNAAIEITDAE